MIADQPKNVVSQPSIENSSAKMDSQVQPALPQKAHEVRLNLSTQNRLVLLVACMLALCVLATLFALDTWPVLTWPVRTSKQVRVEITYEEMFQEIAPQYGLDWQMLARQAYQESRLNPLAVGRDYDTGLMQIVPATWHDWAPQVGVTDPFDPYSNVLVAAAYLAFLREYFSEMGYHEDRWMLVAYNWGPHNLRRLLEQGGDWEQVPPKRRDYALAVLEATSDLPPGWGHIRDEPVIKMLNIPKEKP